MHSLYYYNDAVGHRMHGGKLFTSTIHTRVNFERHFFFFKYSSFKEITYTVGVILYNDTEKKKSIFFHSSHSLLLEIVVMCRTDQAYIITLGSDGV